MRTIEATSAASELLPEAARLVAAACEAADGDDLAAARELAALLGPSSRPLRLALLATLSEADRPVGAYLTLTMSADDTDEDLLLALAGLHGTLPHLRAADTLAAVLDAHRGERTQLWWDLFCRVGLRYEDTALACWQLGEAAATAAGVRGGLEVLAGLAEDWEGAPTQLGDAAVLAARAG